MSGGVDFYLLKNILHAGSLYRSLLDRLGMPDKFKAVYWVGCCVLADCRVVYFIE